MSLTLFSASVDPHGGEVRLAWSYPDVQTGELTIFKRAENAVTDDEIDAYVAGDMTDVQLSNAGIFVFRSIPVSARGITDFAVENNRPYSYRATFIDKVAHTYDDVITVQATPRARKSVV